MAKLADEPRDIVWQTRSSEPTAYENALGDALERILADGVHDLPGICGRLNEIGVKAADGSAWTESVFQAQMKRFGS